MIHQDGTVREYRYEDQNPDGTPHFRHLLTGIVDENGALTATYAYDDRVRAIVSEHVGGANRVELRYVDDPAEPGNWNFTEVTQSLGEIVEYCVTGGAFRKPESLSDSAGQLSFTYTAQNRIDVATDRNGFRTDYDYDTLGR